jgi:hypothetical protein
MAHVLTPAGDRYQGFELGLSTQYLGKPLGLSLCHLRELTTVR